jgi:hypothetical protein
VRFWVVTVPVWLLAPAVLAATARSLLWYHDHVMSITKLDVKAGSRDSGSPLNDRERDLGLRVLRFRVAGEAASVISIPRELATDYEPLTADGLAGARRRAIVLVEAELGNEPNMLAMRELAVAVDDDAGPQVSIVDGDETTRYRVVAAHFEDTTTFFPRYMDRCHIVEHEDRDMMRPFVTMARELTPFMA